MFDCNSEIRPSKHFSVNGLPLSSIRWIVLQVFNFSNIVRAPESFIPHLLKWISSRPPQSDMASATNVAPKFPMGVSDISIIFS